MNIQEMTLEELRDELARYWVQFEVESIGSNRAWKRTKLFNLLTERETARVFYSDDYPAFYYYGTEHSIHEATRAQCNAYGEIIRRIKALNGGVVS